MPTSRQNITAEIQGLYDKLCAWGVIETDADPSDRTKTVEISRVQSILEASARAQSQAQEFADFMQREILDEMRALERRIENPDEYDLLRKLLKRIIDESDRFRQERALVPVYADALSLYILTLYRCASPGCESALIRIILNNICKRKAIELAPSQFEGAYSKFHDVITVAIIAKRYSVYVLCTKGLRILFRAEIEFRTFGTSPEALALQITSLLLKNGVRLADVTEIVCGGGDVGTLPDGIFVLTERMRDESWKRLHNSSLNRGALVAWELRSLLMNQGRPDRINSSLASPLSFSTVGSYEHHSLLRDESRELKQSLKGYVKVTPLKSMAALLSEIQEVRPDNLNLLVMSLDELFASVARKVGPRIVREMAAQEANATLIHFDFPRIVERLKEEGFLIPPHFRLASREIGTGVKEICELLMILDSGKISVQSAKSLAHVVDSYARQVAMVLETASAGAAAERPAFIVITSMLALDPYFQQLFRKIIARLDNPFTPVMCLDSLEHEYLIANHLFEVYVNPVGDKRLHFAQEIRSMRQALRILGAAGPNMETFSFAGLLDEITGYIADGAVKPASLVVVGADNEDALIAAAEAKDFGLIDRLALIGEPHEVTEAIERAKVSLSPGLDPTVEIVPINPLSLDSESKKHSLAETFRQFRAEHPDHILMKGGVDTATLLKEALSIYKPAEGETDPRPRKLASHTALFVLPDGRFFALADAAVNPGFRNSESLLRVVENLVDVVRKVADANRVLKVAIITAVEKETSAIPSTLLAAEVEHRAAELDERYGPLVIEGPLSFDLATVPGVAEEKQYEGKIQGDADCLVTTDINTANVLYKMLSKTMGSLGLIVENGGIITAGPDTTPIVLTSRGDAAQTKFNSILLAMAYVSPLHAERTKDNLTERGLGKLKLVTGGD